MKPSPKTDRASVLSITVALSLVLISSGLFAFSFKAAEATGVAPVFNVPLQPMVTCGGPIRVEATNSANDANYATLAAAFAAVNAGTHTGTINIGVCASVTDGTMATLNASGTGSASYTSVVLTPAGGAARTLDGAIVSGSALIDLNGADNVAIDGLNTGGNSLTISNTTVSLTAGTSTIRLRNGASNNTITGCTVRGSSTSSTTIAGGNILISTSSSGANTGNIISTNDLGPAGSNLPTKCVMSLGSASPNNNTLNVITGNNVFDFFNATSTVAGISISNNTDTTTISNNRIYQTAARTFTGASLRYNGILVSPGTAGSAIITGNIIGFGATDGSGTTTISGSTNTVCGIQAPNTSTTVATSIQNNTVSGFNQTTNQGSTGSTSGFIGISVGATGGLFNIGGTTGNRIGSLDGSTTIVINNTTTSPNIWGFVGIFDFSFQDLDVVSSNSIGAITINSGGSGTGAGFRGIRMAGTSGQNVTINNNTIGGTGAGAIVDNVVGTYTLYAIDNASSNLTGSGNLIRNISGNTNTTGVISVGGIVVTGTPTGVSTISGNTIHSLTDNAGTSSGAIYAIYGSFPATANVVEKNIVHSLNITSTNLAAQIVGIAAAAGSGTYRNNMVRLGVDSAGASITGGYAMSGLLDLAGTNNFYFNSVYIGGTGVVSSSNTFAFVSNVVTNPRSFVDNIFANARDNASGAGKNYAIAVGGAAPNPAGLTSHHNDLYTPGSGGFVGLFNALDQTTLVNWQTATGQDASSFSADPQFLDPNGTARPGFGNDNDQDVLASLVNLHISPTSPCIAAGVPVAGVPDDIDNQLRHPSNPDVGADQNSVDPFPTPTPGPPTPTGTPIPTPTPPTPTPGLPTPTSTPTPTPGPPTPTPTPGPPTPTPTSTPTITVSAPVFTMDVTDGFAVNNQPVTTTFIDPNLNYIGFQADLVYDSAIAAPTPVAGALVTTAGLTASGWTIGSTVLLPGPGTLRTLRISAFSNDGKTPLNGAGTLYLIRWKRASSIPGATTPLTWAPFPNDFEFVNGDLNLISPSQSHGSITITGASPTPTPCEIGGIPPDCTLTPPTPTPGPLSVSGIIQYCSNPIPGPVPGVTLIRTGISGTSTLSDASGNYLFTGLFAFGSYTITPFKVARAPGSAGISTVDMVATQRHFLNLGTPLSGCRLTAADVNGSATVDTVDAIAIQRFFLALSTGLANVGKYQFSPVSRSYTPLNSSQTGQNYDTLILGDVAAPFVE